VSDAFFQDGAVLARTAVVGVLAYVCLVVFLRVSGRRTLSKMNAFDFVVTVALGSTLATILLNRDVSLAEGALALALLIVLQFVITWTSVRVSWVQRLVTGDPVLLLHDGCMLSEALRKARVTHDELLASVRAAGVASLDDVKAVVLETDGSFSVIRRSDEAATSLSGVKGSGR
jgi:uncharacterized membrane protein YcaP (DUF421 family)